MRKTIKYREPYLYPTDKDSDAEESSKIEGKRNKYPDTKHESRSLTYSTRKKKERDFDKFSSLRQPKNKLDNKNRDGFAVLEKSGLHVDVTEGNFLFITGGVRVTRDGIIVNKKADKILDRLRSRNEHPQSHESFKKPIELILSNKRNGFG